MHAHEIGSVFSLNLLDKASGEPCRTPMSLDHTRQNKQQNILNSLKQTLYNPPCRLCTVGHFNWKSKSGCLTQHAAKYVEKDTWHRKRCFKRQEITLKRKRPVAPTQHTHVTPTVFFMTPFSPSVRGVRPEEHPATFPQTRLALATHTAPPCWKCR